MHHRCCDKDGPRYKYYGGKGIKVCKEWQSVTNFYNWAISNGYQDNLSIDRINNDGDYCPENCRFVDRKTQMRNRSNNHLITINGVTKNMAQWADDMGLPRYILHGRVRNGWPLEYLSLPINAIWGIKKFIKDKGE